MRRLRRVSRRRWRSPTQLGSVLALGLLLVLVTLGAQTALTPVLARTSGAPPSETSISSYRMVDGVTGAPSLRLASVHLSSITLYNVTFNESGLPAGTPWNVTVNGTTLQTTANNTTIQLADGTYSYDVGSVPSFQPPSPSGGPLVVAGEPLWINISYSACSYGSPGEVAGQPVYDVPLGDTETYHWTIVLYGGSCPLSFAFQFPAFSAGPGQSLPIFSVWSATPLVQPNTDDYVDLNVTMPDDPLDLGGYWDGFVGASEQVPCGATGGACIYPGVAKNVHIYAQDAFNTTFQESGLPASTNWSVTTNSSFSPNALSSDGANLTFLLANYSYSYVASAPGYGSVAGSVTVNGTSLNVSVPFCKNKSCRVTFAETGLPGGTTWQVSMNGTTKAADSDQIAFLVPDGSYSYSIGGIPGYHPATYTGTVTVRGSAVKIAVPYVRSEYVVRFSETGLRSAWKTSWCVTLNSVEQCSSSSSISFTGIPNGTYAYALGAIQNFSLVGSYTGTVLVAGGAPGSQSNLVTVVWKLITYTVTFRESGLPAGTKWSVSLNHHAEAVTSKTASFAISNGTYSFRVSAAGYAASPASGTISVDGASVTVHVTFAQAESSSRGYRSADGVGATTSALTGRSTEMLARNLAA